MLPPSDMADLSEELDMVDLLEVSDMEVSSEEGLLEQLLHLPLLRWYVEMHLHPQLFAFTEP